MIFKNKFKFLFFVLYSFTDCLACPTEFAIKLLELQKKDERNREHLKSFSGRNDLSSGFYDLYNFVQGFFKEYNIQYPLNLEFSAKISDQGFDNQRYVISIPKTYFNDLPSGKYNDITAFIPNQYVRDKIKDLVSGHNAGSLIYAVDFFKGQKKYKVYFDFPTISKKGITSFEWLARNSSLVRRSLLLCSSSYEEQVGEDGSDSGIEGKDDFTVRDYKPIDFATFKTYLNQILSVSQRRIFSTIREFLDFNHILLKEKGSEKSVCVKFKKDILVKDVKNGLKSLAKIYKDSGKFSLFLDKIDNLKISWIHLQKDEIAIYVRANDWVYYV